MTRSSWFTPTWAGRDEHRAESRAEIDCLSVLSALSLFLRWMAGWRARWLASWVLTRIISLSTNQYNNGGALEQQQQQQQQQLYGCFALSFFLFASSSLFAFSASSLSSSRLISLSSLSLSLPTLLSLIILFSSLLFSLTYPLPLLLHSPLSVLYAH